MNKAIGNIKNKKQPRPYLIKREIIKLLTDSNLSNYRDKDCNFLGKSEALAEIRRRYGVEDCNTVSGMLWFCWRC